MKLSTFIFAAAAAEDKKVPPRHPLQRLARLNQFANEILNQWFDFLPSKDGLESLPPMPTVWRETFSAVTSDAASTMQICTHTAVQKENDDLTI